MGCEIVLVNPPFPARFNGMPMNLLTLGSYLEYAGISVKILDLCVYDSPLTALLSIIESESPSLLALGSYSPSHPAAAKLAKEVKERFPEMAIVKGGIHETFVPQITLERHPYVDFTVRGDGELPLKNLLASIKGKKRIEDVPSLSYRNKSNQIIHNPYLAASRTSINNLPPTNYSLIEASKYYDFSIFEGKKTAQIITSRGCPFNCTFCPASRFSDQTKGFYRWQTAEKVVAEISILKERGVSAVFFDDSVFTVNRNKTIQICRALTGNGIEWGCQTRVDCVDEELLREMRVAGCTYIFFGIESGDDHQLETMRKDLKSSLSWMAIQQACDVGLKVGISLILGFPGETDDQVLNTFRKISSFDRKQVSVSLSMFSLYPGTEEWVRAERNGLISQDSYETIHSTEEMWSNFDEGIGGIHLVSLGRAGKLLNMAMDILGERIELNLPENNFLKLNQYKTLSY